MALILIEEDDTFNEWRLKNNDLGTFVGDVDNLGTTAKVIVNAINAVLGVICNLIWGLKFLSINT
jgi:hypothetical protein